MAISVDDLKKLRSLKFESAIVFIMVSSLIENKIEKFLSFEGAVEAITAFEEAKKRLDRVYIVLKPEDGKEMIAEINSVTEFDESSFLLRAIKVATENKKLFLAQDDRQPLIDSLVAISKFW